MSEPRSNRGRTGNEDRLPPHAEEAERAVLGACLLEPGCVPNTLKLLRDGRVFRDLRHALGWEAITRLHGEGKSPDTILVHQ